MKRETILLTFIFIFAAVSAFASKKDVFKGQIDQLPKVEKKKTKTPKKYNISLFRFVTPYSQPKTDTLKKKQVDPAVKDRFKETTYFDRQKPLDFFKFS